ncbi:hypothetical protein [Rhizobium sp. IBUN]|uniref:hypothetical protein n=1 Tax=Rhizobium sp. IBUN TaxID=1042326 RepID=UPI0003FD747C|nr:hypothetical protein [Rhizobium sp. IBUN]
MQLLETHVGSVVDGKLTVEFVGEGGELVSVRMATDDRSLGGDSAVRRAKEVLVQLTAFGTDATTFEPVAAASRASPSDLAERDEGQ